MTMEGVDLISLESNLHRYHPVIISQIINMIEVDNCCHYQTFESVKRDLRNMWSEGIQELENARTHCTNDDENRNEMEEIEVIDLCSVSRCENDSIPEGKESAMQESQDRLKHDKMDRKLDEFTTERDDPTIKKYNVESAMMCWEPTENLEEEEPRDEQEKVANKIVETTEKQKHEEEHVGPTLATGNRLKISIEEFSWEKEDDESTFETEEPESGQLVYITNLENGLQMDGTELNDEIGPNEKSLLHIIGLLKCPPLIILSMKLIFTEKLVMTPNTLKISPRERTKRTRKNTSTLRGIRKRKESEPTY